MKRTLLFLFAVLSMAYSTSIQAQNVWDGTVATTFAGGSGTEADPYLIADGAQLARFAAIVNGTDGMTQNISACGIIITDIILNNISNWESWNENTTGLNSWTPIGNFHNEFIGTLDGQGHSVSGIYISNNNDHQGLVGYLNEGGKIQNLGVEASYIKGKWYVGGVCGMNYGSEEYESVKNCYNTGKVTGADFVGGVCGSSFCMTNCYNTGIITGHDNVGGVCGFSESILSNCYNAGDVTGNDKVGGVSGSNINTMDNCYNIGQVAGNTQIGGIIGTTGGTIRNCYYLTGTAAGGINGNNIAGKAEAKSDVLFASGEVAWLLQNGQTEQVWGQTINTDSYPLWQTENNKVYQLSLQDREETNVLYANSGTFTLPVPAEVTGYTFAGWFTAQTDGEQILDNATLTEDKTLYAQWNINSYTIRFVDEEGTELQSSEVEYGQTPAYEGKEPTKESTAEFDYTFAGWTPEITAVTGEATYTATYTENKRSYTLTVALAEGCEGMGEVSGSGNYEYGSEVTLTATANDGYKFMQWNDGDTNATRTIIVEGEVTLTATFESDGGSGTGLQEQTADTFRVIGTEGCIRIEGSEQEACVFNTTGQLIYRGTKRIIEMHATGIYLVRIGNETQHVMIR